MGTDRHRIFDLINSGELNLKAKDKHGYPIYTAAKGRQSPVFLSNEEQT